MIEPFLEKSLLVCPPFHFFNRKSRLHWSCHLPQTLGFSSFCQPHRNKKPSGDRRPGDCQQWCCPGWHPQIGFGGKGVKKHLLNQILTPHDPKLSNISNNFWHASTKFQDFCIRKVYTNSFAIYTSFLNIFSMILKFLWSFSEYSPNFFSKFQRILL